MTLTQFKNKTLLRLGFTLVNNQGNTVYLDKPWSYKAKQIRSNRNRTRRYSMDDKFWQIKWD